MTEQLGKMKPTIIIIILLCVAIGVYSWRQRQQAFEDLAQLESTGADIQFSIKSRPIMAVDVSRKTLYLVGLGKVEEVPFANITEIQFVETPETGNNASEPRGPDTAVIKTVTQTYRVGDLPDSAQNVKKTFEQQGVLSDKLTLTPKR